FPYNISKYLINNDDPSSERSEPPVKIVAPTASGKPMQQPKVTLEQWSTFKAVVDAGSFAAAAELLNKSQSSVSYILARMQSRLPAPALRLNGRKAELTNLGKVLYRQANVLLAQAIAIDKAAEYVASGWEQEVVIAADALVPMNTLFCSLQAFSLTHQSTRVRILETTLSGTDEAIFARVANIVLSPHIPTGFLGRPLWQVRMIPVVAASHTLATTTGEISETLLQQHRQIVIRDTGTKREQNAGWLGSEQRWTVSHFSSCIDAIRAGLGFAFVPQDKIEEELVTGALVQLPLRFQAEHHLTVNLIIPDGDHAGPATLAIADTLIEMNTLTRAIKC
ncbi:MAG: DNA-binding transcriptional LysR family regulator, partial [Candidatus Azotimanducaceae bacterium]